MNNEENIKKLIQSIQVSEGVSFNYNETELLQEYKLKDENNSSLVIKILSIIGGFFATLAFLGFFVLAGLYDSQIGLIIFGGGFIIAAIWLNKIYEKLIVDTLSISLYVIGFALVAGGLFMFDVDEDIIASIILIIAACSLLISQSYLLSFISIIIINGCLLVLIASNNLYNLIHLYITFNTFLLVFVFLNEAKIITSHKKLSKLYNPIRIGLVISLLMGLFTIGITGFITVSSNFIWISSLVFFTAIIYVVSKIVAILTIESSKNKNFIYLFSALLLLPTALSPSISGALLILLLCFYVNYKTGMVLGIISFIYFISQYYYDLHFTLPTKFTVMMIHLIFFISTRIFY